MLKKTYILNYLLNEFIVATSPDEILITGPINIFFMFYIAVRTFIYMFCYSKILINLISLIDLKCHLKTLYYRCLSSNESLPIVYNIYREL